MRDRPVHSRVWSHCEIVWDVEEDAQIEQSAGNNRVLRLNLKNLGSKPVQVSFRPLVIEAPTAFEPLDAKVPYLAAWPKEAQPWLAATWGVDHDELRLKALAMELRKDTEDVNEVIRRALAKVQAVILGERETLHAGLRASTALDRNGSCTSNANLLAALL